MKNVIAKLEEWQRELESQKTFSSDEARNNHSARLSEIKEASELLVWCTKHHISPIHTAQAIPEVFQQDYQAKIRIVDDGESNNPCHWKELEFEGGRKICLFNGDLIIRGHNL